MNYLSVCSGVEAASQAWITLGWKAVAFSEIEPFPCAVLASRFPDVPNLGDMTKITYDKERDMLSNGATDVVCNGGIDLLVGGTPCQSFSVAGNRKGLEGASGLAAHYARLIGEIRPSWFVWENVTGALSSVTYGEQRDFNFLLHAFAVGGNPSLGLRYNCEWRVLDTQYVRVEQFPRAIPQRRRRVFIVGHLATDGECRSQVLLEQDGLRGDTPPRRVKGKGFARGVAKGLGGAGGSLGVDGYNADVTGDVSKELNREDTVYSVDQGGGKSSCSVHEEVAPTTTTTHQGEPVINQPNNIVRRITPIEGERLQGFADNWTRPCFTGEMITDALVDQFIDIHAHWAEVNGKPDAKRKSREQVRKWLMTISSSNCPDGPRNKCIGNSMSVNVMQWIGQRIELAERSMK